MSTTFLHPMRFNFVTSLACAVAALTFAAAVHADPLDDIRKKDEIVFGVPGTDEPNNCVDPKTRDSYAKLGPAKKDCAVLPTSISVEPLALGLRKNEPALEKVVDDTLRGLESSGEADGLFIAWCGPATRLQFDQRSFKSDSDRI